LTRVFGHFALQLNNSFNKWRNNAHIMKIAEARDGEVAGGLLNNLNKFLLGSNESKIREILKRFHKYAAYGKVLIIFIKILTKDH
jgi:archaellum biogenesis ATPase FlaH